MFDKADIFRTAHEEAKYYRRFSMPPQKETYAASFARCLKEAWRRAQLRAGEIVKIYPRFITEEERLTISCTTYRPLRKAA